MAQAVDHGIAQNLLQRRGMLGRSGGGKARLVERGDEEIQLADAAILDLIHPSAGQNVHLDAGQEVDPVHPARRGAVAAEMPGVRPILHSRAMVGDGDGVQSGRLAPAIISSSVLKA